MTAADVIAGRAQWSVEQADCLAWLNSLPEQSIDFCLGSPPYSDCRWYLEDGKNLGIARNSEEWARWLFAVTKAALRVCRGLVAWVVDDATKNYRYQAGPMLLMADLHRAGVCLRKPLIYHRIGIPGSGGPDWLRGDCELIVCCTNGGKLPWSDPTAMGHVPKYAPGGEMSHRVTNGERVSKWGKSSHGGTRNKDGTKDFRPRPSHKPQGSKECEEEFFELDEPAPRKQPSLCPNGGNRRRADGTRETISKFRKTATRGHKDGDTDTSDSYDQPVLANPGNCIRESLTITELIEVLVNYGQANSSTADQVLRELRQANAAGRIKEWFYGVCLKVEATAVLQHSLLIDDIQERGAGQDMSALREPDTAEKVPKWKRRELEGVQEQDVLQSAMPRCGDIASERTDMGWSSSQGQKTGQTDDAASDLRELRQDESSGDSSSGRGCDQQRSEQSPCPVLVVSSERTQERVLQSRRVYTAVLRTGLLQQALPALQEVWRSVNQMLWQGQAAESSSLIHCVVGGGSMGSPLASRNEAPFSSALCEFMIRTFCEPGGVCCDPFSGSGTTAAVAVEYGRRAVACDLRQSQVALSKKRVEQVTPRSLFQE